MGIQDFFNVFSKKHGVSSSAASYPLKVLRRGLAARVVFFYPGEEGTYMDQVHVTLYENGMVHIQARYEEISTHLQNCEILWSYDREKFDEDQKYNKLKLVKLHI